MKQRPTLDDLLKPYEGFEDGKLEFKNRHFEFKMPNPWDGCALFNMISSYRIPFAIDTLFHTKNSLPSLPSESLKDLQILCLQHCFESLLVGLTPVVDEFGNFRIVESNISAPLLYHLTVGYLLFFAKCWGDADSLISNLETPTSTPPKQ